MWKRSRAGHTGYGLACVLILTACASSSPEASVSTVSQREPATENADSVGATDPIQPNIEAVATTLPVPSVADTEAGLATGRWQVTELAGSITAIEVGPAPPDGLCAPFRDTYEPLLTNPDTWIELAPTRDETVWEEDFEEMLLADALEALRSGGVDVSPLEYEDMVLLPGPVDSLFLFSFAFDNGHQSNNPLAGTESAYLTIERGSTNTEYWGVVQEAVASVSAGTASQISGIFSGESVFSVQGEWSTPDQLHGTWFFNEIAVGAGCKLLSTGAGTWAAARS